MGPMGLFSKIRPSSKTSYGYFKNIPLGKPIDRTSLPFVKNGCIDENGVLKYNYSSSKDAKPSLLTVVHHVFQILVLLYFHKKMGCGSKDLTIRRAL